MILLYSTCSKKNLYFANHAKEYLAVVNCQLLDDSNEMEINSVGYCFFVSELRKSITVFCKRYFKPKHRDSCT